jgi:hypothetical protein
MSKLTLIFINITPKLINSYTQLLLFVHLSLSAITLNKLYYAPDSF